MNRVNTLILGNLVTILLSCAPKQSGEKALQSVKTDTVRVFGVQQTITFPGKIKAATEVNLAFRVSGPIAKMLVDAGSYVRKGQTLVEMDRRDYEVQLSATEAEYRQVKAEAERVMELYRKGSATPNDYDKATSGLQRITAKYEAHKNALADTRLVAPFDGYVQRRLASEGETVGAGIPVVSMINAGTPEVEINIPAGDFVRRKHFSAYSCKVDMYPGQAFPLDLIGIAPKANMNQLYAMQLKFKNSPTLPSPGMTTMVTIQLQDETSELLTVPTSAVFEHNGIPSVWIYQTDSQTVTRRPITLREFRTDGTTLISTGLQAGDIVISAGVHSISEGEKVRLLSPASRTNVGGLL